MISVVVTCVFLFAAPFSGSAGTRATTLIVGALALAVAAWRGELRGAAPFPRLVLVPFAAWAGLAVASLAWTASRETTLSELRAEVLYGGLALFVFHYAARDWGRLRAWVAALAAGAAVVLLAQGLQSATGFRPERVDGGGGAWTTHLVLAAPMLLAFAWPRPEGYQWPAAALAAAFALLLVGAWAGDSRMVWAALAAELAVSVALWRSMPPMEAARSRAVRGFMAMLAVALAVAGAAMVAERNTRLFGDGAVTTHLERDLRPAIWRTAVATISEAPWLGHGFGRDIRADAFRPLTPSTPDHPEIRHAHNMFVDAAVQLGFVGAAAFAALLAALALAHGRLLASPRAAPLGLLGLAILAGFITKNLTDDFFFRHNAQVFWALNGALLGLGGRLARTS